MNYNLEHHECCSVANLLLRAEELKIPTGILEQSTVGFPTRRDSETFQDKGTEVPSLSRDKGTTGQAKYLAKGWDGPGQPVKIRDRM